MCAQRNVHKERRKLKFLTVLCLFFSFLELVVECKSRIKNTIVSFNLLRINTIAAFSHVLNLFCLFLHMLFYQTEICIVVFSYGQTKRRMVFFNASGRKIN